MPDTSIEELLDRGIAAQQAGELTAAERCYREALAIDPADADALHLLGVTLHQTGRSAEGVRCLAAAVERVPDDAVFRFNCAEALRAMGRYEDAIPHYEKVLELDASLVQAHLPLGECLAGVRRNADAVLHLQTALEMKPSCADLLRITGCALSVEGWDLAEASAKQLMDSESRDARSLIALAGMLKNAGRNEFLGDVFALLIDSSPTEEHFVGGVTAYANAGDFLHAEKFAAEGAARFPRSAGLHFAMGYCSEKQGQAEEAMRHYKAAIDLDPGHVPARVNLAVLLRSFCKNMESMEHLLEAQRRAPKSFEVLCNLGMTQKSLGRLEEAEASARASLELKPDDSVATNLLAVTLHQMRRSSEAVALLEKHLASHAADREAHSNLGIVYSERGQLPEALAHFTQAAEIEPRVAEICSNLLLTANYDDGMTPRALYELHRQWAMTQRGATPANRHVFAPTRRRIRVGYVSPDFRTHSVVFFSCPILMNHNRDDFEIFCYSDVKSPDNVTKLLQSFGHQWRDILGLSTDRCTRLIQEDGIDILVDLAGHTAENRLSVFAGRAAPIQVGLIGYPNTTGLAAMDYQITDGILHPEEAEESFATEKLVRLPDIFACYRPPDHPPAVGALPAVHAGRITFGYFNNLAKLRPFMLRLWGEIARQIPSARFIIQTSALCEADTCALLAEECRKAGLGLDRVEFKGQSSLAGFHDDLNAVDIVLDPSPFNGHTTSCQILHMGVPIVTLAGVTRSSRMGASLLTNVGLTELIATSPEEYVRIAVALANDIPRLSAIRVSLRGRMESSAIMDGKRYTRHLENAYREMWEVSRASNG